MVALELLIHPSGIFDRYPAREWRQITLWLKWGLLFATVGTLIPVLVYGDPSTRSVVFSTLESLDQRSTELAIPFAVKLILFIVIYLSLLIVVWLFKGLVIGIGYQTVQGAFLEPRVALSISAAALVPYVWNIVPFIGYYMAMVHSIYILIYLLGRVNRISTAQATILGILAGVIPILY